MERAAATQPDLVGQPYTILVAVAGGSPAIVTETFWRLVKKQEGKERIRIDEVRIITTEKGKKAVWESLLVKGAFAACCHECGLNIEHVRFDDETIFVLKNCPDASLADILNPAVPGLADIRNSCENGWAADQISLLIREWTKDEDTRLFCSVAGGRKTMSIYLTAAMMLYGRLGDRLFHVLVQPEALEFCQDFFFPCAKTVSYVDRFTGEKKSLSAAEPDAQIDLAEIPFVSVRALVPEHDQQDKENSYLSIVEETQNRLQLRAPHQTLCIYKMQLTGRYVPVEINGVSFELTPAAGVFYALLAERQKNKVDDDDDGGLELDEISSRDLKRLFEQLSGWRYEQLAGEETFSTIDSWIKQLAEYNLDDFKPSVQQMITREINNKFREQGVPKDFQVSNANRNLRDKETGERKPARYLIELPAEAITLAYLPKS